MSIKNLNEHDAKVLNLILPHIPLKDKFWVSNLYNIHIIVPEHYPSLQLDKTNIIGHSDDADRINKHLQPTYESITDFLVENDFADRDGDKVHQTLILTDKGRELYSCGNLEYYEGLEVRKQHAKENRDIIDSELKESQIKLNKNQIDTNNSIKITNENITDANKALKRIFRWTAIIAGAGVLIAAINTILEVRKDTLSQRLHTKDSLLQVKNFEIYRLKTALDSVHHKP
jgi:hypothetical protein